MATATQRAEDADKSAGLVEVSLPQKMMSAVSGSILTSLLGACLYYFRRRISLPCFCRLKFDQLELQD
jgi:solute carrier family 25 protein 39/40